MSLTRKHFKGIAEALSRTRSNTDYRLGLVETRIKLQIAENLAQYLRSTNERFDKAKFIAACLNGVDAAHLVNEVEQEDAA